MDKMGSGRIVQERNDPDSYEVGASIVAVADRSVKANVKRDG